MMKAWVVGVLFGALSVGAQTAVGGSILAAVLWTILPVLATTVFLTFRRS